GSMRLWPTVTVGPAARAALAPSSAAEARATTIMRADMGTSWPRSIERRPAPRRARRRTLGAAFSLEPPMAARAVRFYFDYISPNAYLAWSQLHAMAERHGRSVEPVPVLFAGLLEAHGQLGPAEVPPKALWMARNNLRKATLLGIPLRPPASHPFNPLLVLRVSSLPIEEDARRRLIDALFAATWARELRVDDPAVVARAVDEAGLDGEALVAEAGRAESKARLRQQTELAIGAGVFGVPTAIVDGELFWGYDDFPFLERFLAGSDPIDGEAAKAWRRPIP